MTPSHLFPSEMNTTFVSMNLSLFSSRTLVGIICWFIGNFSKVEIVQQSDDVVMSS